MNKNEELLPYYKMLKERIYWKDGKPYWNITYGPRAVKNTLAGSVKEGYRHISPRIDGKSKYISVHRLRWFMEYKYLPEEELDHIDNDQDNNRISNLRKSSRAENNRNTSGNSNSTSKFKGVSYKKSTGKWLARIRNRHLGYFISEEEASEAYKKAAKELFKEFAYNT